MWGCEEEARDTVAVLRFNATDASTAETRLKSHPGNVNADGHADASDILALIDSLRDPNTFMLSIYQCDLDDSGECDPGDLIRLIDLLNGGGSFDAWFGTQIPSASEECP